MRGCTRFITFILAILLIVTLPLSLLVFNVGRVVFDRDLVKGVVTEIVTQSDLIPVGLAWFSESRAQARVEAGLAQPGTLEPDVLQLMAFLDADDWRAIKGEVLTDEILAAWVAVAVDGVYDWIDSDERVPQIAFDMQPFKARVGDEPGLRSVEIVYEALPACSEAQIEDFKQRLSAAPPGTEVLYNLCRFPDPWREDQFSDYLDSLDAVVNSVPATFDLTGEVAQAENPAGVGPEAIKAQLRLLKSVYWVALFVPLGLLALIWLFGARSLDRLGRWWGTPLTLGGLIALIIALVYRPVVTGVLAAGPLSEVPQDIQQEAIQAVLRLAEEVFQPLLIQSLVIVVLIGLGLVLIGGAIGRRRG